MKAATIISVCVVTLLAASALAQAQPPPGVGAADVTRLGCFVGWVDVGGQSTPILPGGEGFVLVFLEDSVRVFSNDKNGNRHLSCHGRLPLGEDALASDLVTGAEILATLATLDETCAALAPVFPEVCRGRAAIMNYETLGVVCTVGGIPTTHFRAIYTQTGRVSLSCHVLP